MINHLLLWVFPNPFPALLLFPFVGWLTFRYPRDKRCELWLILTMLIVPLSLVTINIAKALTYLTPVKYDEYLYMIEMRFGLPGYHMARFLWHHPILQGTILVIYNTLPYELVAIFGVYLWKVSIKEALKVLETQALLYVMIFMLYVVFPAVGPNLAISGFPYDPPNITVPHPLNLVGTPNCMPSGHLGTALLTLWFARKWIWGIILSSVFVIGTVIATLTVGGHYTLDLIMAIPYTALIIYLGDGCGFLKSHHGELALDTPVREAQYGYIALEGNDAEVRNLHAYNR